VRRRHATLAPLLAALLATGCARCGAPRAASPPAERFVPSSVSGALIVPRLEEASRQAAALHATLAALPGAGELGQLRSALGAQLSVDLLDPASLTGAGLDVARGLAVAELAPAAGGEAGLPLLVLPVADPAKLEALLARLARDRLGAAEKGMENANGTPLQVWRRAAGEPALLASVLVEGSALVSAGPGGPDALRAALKLDPALSLAQSAGWQRARAALGEEAALLFWLPPGSPSLQGAPAVDGLVAGLSATARSARLVAAALLGAQEARLRPLAGPGPGRSEPSPLDPATVLAARLSASPAAVLELAAPPAERGRHPEGPQKVAEAFALGELAAALEPPLDLGLGLSPRADVAGAFAARGQLQPLRVVTAEAVANLKAGAKLGPYFDGIVARAGGTGKDGRWRVPVGDAEVAWTVSGGRLLASAGPRGGLDALVSRAGGRGWKAPTPAGAQAMAGGLGGAVLHLDNLVTAVKALPPEAYGTGPDAVMARSLAGRLTAPAGRHAGISLRADLPAGALRLALEVELGEPPTAP